jgi:hypothetical protein
VSDFNFVKTARILRPCWFRICIVFIQILLLKNSRNGYKYIWAYVCVILVLSPECRIKFGLLKLFLLKNDQIFFLMIWSGLPDYHRSTSMFKTSVQGCIQSYHDALAYFSIIFTLHVFLSNLPSKRVGPMWPTLWELGLMKRFDFYSYTHTCSMISPLHHR